MEEHPLYIWIACREAEIVREKACPVCQDCQLYKFRACTGLEVFSSNVCRQRVKATLKLILDKKLVLDKRTEAS